MEEHGHGIVADVPRRHARERGAATALVFEGRETTWAELDALSSRAARALLAAGVRPGARVGILARDSDELFALVFGVAKAGAVVLGINWRLAAPEIGYILADAGAEIVFVAPELADKLESCRASLPRLRAVVPIGAGESFAAWCASAPADDPRLPATPEDPFCQMYTSGTTGNPKGVRLANRSFFAVVAGMRRRGDPWIGWSARDVSLSGFPSFHIGGLWWDMTAFEAGATSIVLDTFVGWRAIEAIERWRVTKTCMVAAMMQMMLSEPNCGTADLGSLDCIVYGGSPITQALLERGMRTFGCRFAQIYGLTETGNTAVCLRPEDHARPELLRAAGRPYPGVLLEVRDEGGRPLPAGAVGEICIRSPANMLGYWNLPEATARTLVDGWIRTGDAGHLDEEGYVYVSDRIKDMIIYAGENVYPAEVENALASHPAVKEVAVIGVADPAWGERIKAIVVLVPGRSARPAELLAHARRRLADFKVPHAVDFVDALPRTPSGKVKKHELRRAHAEPGR